MIFHGCPGGAPDLTPHPVDGNLVASGSLNHETMNHEPLTYDKSRLQYDFIQTEDTRIQDRGDPSQPGGPSTEGPAD